MSTAHRTGHLAVVGAGALWGTAGTTQAVGHLSGMGFAVGAARTMVATAALLALWAVVDRRLSVSVWTCRMLLAAAGAGAALALYQTMFFVGTARTGVAIGTLVAVGLAPVVAGGLAVAIRHNPSPTWILGTGLSVAGLALLLMRTHSQVNAWGVLASTSAAFAYVIYTALTRHLLEHGADPRDILIVIFLVGALVSAPAIVLNWRQTTVAVSDTRGIAAILVLGLVSTFIPYLLWIRGMRTVRTTLATTLSMSEPLVGTLLAIAVLNERFTVIRTIGATLLIAGLVLATRAKATTG